MTSDENGNINTSHQRISWFNGLGRNLVLRPPFQRRPVWTDEQKSFLVDTIMRGYPVPEIYVYADIDEEDNDRYYVIDGQQRLRACLDYMNDRFPATYDVSKLPESYDSSQATWYNKRYSELSTEDRKQFRSYQLIVREIKGASPEEIRHMFFRLNQSNVALNSQELRFSMYEGGILATVELLNRREEWEQFRLFTINQRRRMLDSEFISELVIGHLHWPQNKKDNLWHYYRLYGNRFPFEDEVRERFDATLKLLSETYPEPRMNRTRWYRKSDFYTLFLALSRNQLVAANPAALRRTLDEFSELVNGTRNFAPQHPVTVYREAVERAATDRTRRMQREAALVAHTRGQPKVNVDLSDEYSDVTELLNPETLETELVGLSDTVDEDIEYAEEYEDS